MHTSGTMQNRRSRVLRCAAVALSSLLLVVCDTFAQLVQPPPPDVAVPEEATSLAQRRAREMPRSATSADGFIEVLAADVPGDSMGFRLPLLRFTTQFVEELEHGYGLEMSRVEGRGLVIHALDGETNDVRVITRVVQRDGHVLTRLWLPSPGYTNLEALRFEIAQAYFRAWIDRHRPEGMTQVADELPKWLAFGALNARTADDAHAAIRGVLELDSEKQFPAFPKCVYDLKKIASLQDAILAGYLAAWLKEKHAFQAVLEQLAAGRKWDVAAFLAQLTGAATAEEQARVFKDRLDRQSRAVLSPGRASAWDVKNFRRQLHLDVRPVKDEPADAATQTCTFRHAIQLLADRPAAVRAAAFAKMRELPLYAVRRGQQMAAVSEAYSEFLVMLSRGASAEKLNELLDKAEYQLALLIDGRNGIGQNGSTTLSAPQEDKPIR